MQVDESVRTYGRTVPLRSTVVYGGIPMDPQIKALRAGVEILVATPGPAARPRRPEGREPRARSRSSSSTRPTGCSTWASCPTSSGSSSCCPKRRQNLMFSATFSDDIRRLSGTILRDPATVEVAPRNTTVEGIRQLVYPVDRDRKEALLAHLIRTDDLRQVLVFTRTKLAASRLASRLDREGIDAVAIHSDRSQPERTRALEGFKTGDIRVLVATDVAARGLDIEDLPLVVNFELPWNPQDYIHRIGRTGRAGAPGRGDQPRLHRRGRPAARRPADAQAGDPVDRRGGLRARSRRRAAAARDAQRARPGRPGAPRPPQAGPPADGSRQPAARAEPARRRQGGRAPAPPAGSDDRARTVRRSLGLDHRGAREEEAEHDVGLDPLDAVAIHERVRDRSAPSVAAARRGPDADVAQQHELAVGRVRARPGS